MRYLVALLVLFVGVCLASPNCNRGLDVGDYYCFDDGVPYTMTIKDNFQFAITLRAWNCSEQLTGEIFIWNQDIKLVYDDYSKCVHFNHWSLETKYHNTYFMDGCVGFSALHSHGLDDENHVVECTLKSEYFVDFIPENSAVSAIPPLVIFGSILYEHSKTNREIKQEVYKAKVCGRSWKSDLALVKLDDQQTFFEKTAKVAEKGIVLNFGDDVDLVGYPAGLGLTWTQGKLGYVEDTHGLAFDDISQSTEFYRATPMMTGGSSGSPLFYQDTDGTYKIVGVLTGGGLQYLGFYTPVEEINAYLDTALEGCGLPGKDTTTTSSVH